MLRTRMLGAASAVALWASAAQAQDVLQLEPASPWSLDYADDSCRLIRTFGQGEDEITLGLTAYEPGGRFFLSVVGNPTKPFRSPDTVRVALDEVEDYAVRYLEVDFGGRRGLLITNPISVGPLPAGVEERMRAGQPVDSYSDRAVEAQVKTIGFIDGLEREFILHTGSLGEPMRALKECTTELTTHWNATRIDSLSRIAAPRSPPWTWLQWRAYPREMRQPMLINYRLIVDPEGSVVDCDVAAVEDTSEFAEITCSQLRKNGRFEPALDLSGQAVQSYFVFWAELRG